MTHKIVTQVVTSFFTEFKLNSDNEEHFLCRNNQVFCHRRTDEPQRVCVQLYVGVVFFKIQPSLCFPPNVYKQISIDRLTTIFYTRMLNVIYCIDLSYYVCAMLHHSICNGLEYVSKNNCSFPTFFVFLKGEFNHSKCRNAFRKS